ncbi:hypothetical protein XELAEV_18037250mg [Xenopus laevis]|uniref:Uncharacterized protein n=1 Tax=Xenopus laevis TaxID=8355 RepID=A0A974CCX9_XENLA|nr:hypothetical protein XELAEV_18037250mg [Xenopus laevis]
MEETSFGVLIGDVILGVWLVHPLSISLIDLQGEIFGGVVLPTTFDGILQNGTAVPPFSFNRTQVLPILLAPHLIWVGETTVVHFLSSGFHR